MKRWAWAYIILEGPDRIIELESYINLNTYIWLFDEYLNTQRFSDGSLSYLQDSASIHRSPNVSKWAKNNGISNCDALILSNLYKNLNIKVFTSFFTNTSFFLFCG